MRTNRLLIGAIAGLLVFGAAPVGAWADDPSVHVRATDPMGDPLSGVSVTLKAAGHEVTGTTGADGTLRFEDLPEGFYRMEVKREGFEEYVSEVVDVRDGVTFVPLRLVPIADEKEDAPKKPEITEVVADAVGTLPGSAPPGERVDIRGQVLDPSGGAIGKASVGLLDSAGIRFVHQTFTDAAGRYDFDNLSGGSFRLRIDAQGFTLFERAIDPSPGTNVLMTRLLPEKADTGGAPGVGPAQGGSIAGHVFEREREDDGADDEKVRDMLLTIGGPGPFDQLRVQTGFGHPGRSRVVILNNARQPDDWSVEKIDDGFILRGSPHSMLTARLEFTGEAPAPPYIDVQMFRSGKVIGTQTFPVERLPLFSEFRDLDSVVTTPPVVEQRQSFAMSVRYPVFEYGHWQATIMGQPVTVEFFDDLEIMGQRLRGDLPIGGHPPLIIVPLPERTDALPTKEPFQQPFQFQFTDQFGTFTIDLDRSMTVLPPDPSGPCAPRLVDCTPRVFAGNLLCVCGCMPDPNMWQSGLQIDGEPVTVLAASTRSARVLVPEGLAPGLHVLSWAEGRPGLQVSPEQVAQFRVLRVAGSINRDKLLRGESTPLELRVYGTEERLTLDLTNLSPEIVSVQGGVAQRLTTSGGAENRVRRTVRGLHKGDFRIDYQLDLGHCACEVLEESRQTRDSQRR